MKVKAIDIAKKLNISKATVSLALNNKPGVSPQTREAIYRCMAELEEVVEPQTKQIIKVINVQRDLHRYAEMDLWAEVLLDFDRAIRQMGYTLGVTYTSMDPQDIEQAIQDANEENVAGVIFCATELLPNDLDILSRIRKPMVVYDNDPGPEYHCSVIGNMAAVRDVVDLLVQRGCRNIKYLGNSVDIYNFRERKAGYRAGLRKNRLELKEDSIMTVGKNTEEVYQYMLKYLEVNKLPDAFIMDNYQVSIGVMRALKTLRVSVPQDVSLVGIDEIPSLVMADYTLSTMKVQHMERGRALMMFLEQEISGGLASKFKIFSNCELIMGNSIR